jgi:signal transduction histidine kinase
MLVPPTEATEARPPTDLGQGPPAVQPVAGSRRRWAALEGGLSLDRWLSAALVYGLLACHLLVLYICILALGGYRGDDAAVPWWLNAISLSILALTIRPVHTWLRSGVHTVVYGQHDDPYAVITQIRASAEADPAPDALLPAVTGAIAGSLKLPFVAIEADLGETPLSAATGQAPEGAETVAIPLAYQGTPVGVLRASSRRAGEPLSAADERLLRDLGQQVGITLHAAQLSAALRASRQQIVTAREEERRRIRRDLHDGLGPTLASLRLQLGAVRRLVATDPAAAEALIDSLRGDVANATADIRRLVYELRPPMLDEFGLVGALRNLGTTGSALALHLDLPEESPPLNAATEVALFRIATEAVRNVERHAGATRCSIRLEVADREVRLTISDDGSGLAAATVPGVGMDSMRERAEELGGSVRWSHAADGGTVVAAVLPRDAMPATGSPPDRASAPPVSPGG